MSKVHCRECKYLTTTYDVCRTTTYECAHPNNIEIHSSWYKAQIVVVKSELNKPHTKNMHNDCNLFKQKSMWQSFTAWLARL